MIVRVGRWIATPDIETQYAPDNYLVSHSLLFTFDTYTQTGITVNISHPARRFSLLFRRNGPAQRAVDPRRGPTAAQPSSPLPPGSPADFSSNALATEADTSGGEEPAPQNMAKNCADCGPLLPGRRSNAPPTRAQSAPHTSLSLARAVSDMGKGCASHVCDGGQLALRIPAFVEGLSARPLT
jgi:hypothetical protein